MQICAQAFSETAQASQVGAPGGLRLMSQEAECKGMTGVLWKASQIPGHSTSSLDTISWLALRPTAEYLDCSANYLTSQVTCSTVHTGAPVPGIRAATVYVLLVQGEPLPVLFAPTPTESNSATGTYSVPLCSSSCFPPDSFLSASKYVELYLP